MKFYLENIKDVFAYLKSSEDGLSSSEAELRLRENGKNEFQKNKKTSIFVKFIKQIIDPMIIILLVAAVISASVAAIKHESFADVIIILAVVVINAILGVYQESKAEKSIEALQKMSAAKSNVIRDGKKHEILSADLVVGDIVVLDAGDSVPADGRIIECASLKIEESSLTGESVAIDKCIDALYLKDSNSDIHLADRNNMAYMGSTVVYGRGKIIITNTGMQTEMGKIAGALRDVKENKTPLQLKMDQLSKILTWLVIGICAVVFAMQIFRSGSFEAEGILNSFMIAISLAVAAIPEGLPAVVTVALSVGVSKMSQRNAIIRKLTAVETLGCAQIICSDKTGTLTQNKMTVTEFYSDDEELLARSVGFCNDTEIVDGAFDGEPTELALYTWANDHKINLDKKLRSGEIPFDSSRKMMTVVNSENNTWVQYTKGAPDVVISKCSQLLKDGKVVPLTDNLRKEIFDQNKKFADKALRVLACATKNYSDTPSNYSSEILEEDMIFVGLIGMIDPIRPEAKIAIQNCKSAGIRPIVITGDHIDTAQAIAKDLNILDENSHAVSGQDLDAMDDQEFSKEFKNISVYARVRPEHKTRIVKAWQDAGYVVAMTGDGVNDAPSIKTADIGVGMGITGTDVTKNVADMVLADDNFASIVNAVEEGRRIYDNILKSIQYLLGSNIGEVLCVFFASLFGFVILLPVHLLLVNMVTDCIPALALSLEKNEPGIMNKKPRPKKAGIFADGVGFDTIYQGIIITILILISYIYGVYQDTGVLAFSASLKGMTMAFLTTCMVGCFHSINMRSRRQSIFSLKTNNWLLYGSVMFSIVLLAVICFVPALNSAFDITSVTVFEFLIAFILGFCIIPIVEIVKFFQRRSKKY